MKRGMLSISKDQLQTAVNYLPRLESNQFLRSKLESGLQANQDPVQILINEEDLDLLLDNLPAPTMDADSLLKETRQVLRECLTSLRFN